MIYISYLGSRVLAQDDGTVVNPMLYWGPDIMAGIQAAFDAGDWESVSDPEPPPPEPDWDGFLADFLTPGNPVYNATATKVQASSFYTQEHWANMRIGVTNPLIRNEQWLQACADFLVTLLETDGNGLTQSEKETWVSLCNAHHITLIL